MAASTSSSPRRSARANGPGTMPVPSIIPMSMSRTPATPSSSTMQASAKAFWPTRSASCGSTTASAPVCIEPLPALAPEVAAVDELLHQAVDMEAVAVGVPQVPGDLQRRVEPGHVRQPERPHRRQPRLGDGGVDRLDVGPRLVLVAPDLRGERAEDAVDDEAGALGAADGDLADRLGEGRGRLGGLRRGVVALDDLDQPHPRGGPEEVEADDLVRALS